MLLLLVQLVLVSSNTFNSPALKNCIATGRQYKGVTFSEKLSQFEISHTTVKSTNEGSGFDGVYACIDLPSLLLGTVGGGTALATQKEMLNLMGCYGKVSWYGN